MPNRSIVRKMPITSDGDALLILVNPTDDAGIPSSGNYEVHFRVQSTVLAKASSCLNTLINGPFQKLAPHHDGLLHFTIDEDLDSEAMKLLLYALHDKTTTPLPFPCTPRLGKMIQIALCMDFMSILIQAMTDTWQTWVRENGLHQASLGFIERQRDRQLNSGKATVTRDSSNDADEALKRLYFFWLFDAELFPEHASALVKHWRSPLKCPAPLRNLPKMPEMIQHINEVRSNLIKAESDRISSIRAQLQKCKFARCSNTCRCNTLILSSLDLYMADKSRGSRIRKIQAVQGPDYLDLHLAQVGRQVAVMILSVLPTASCVGSSYYRDLEHHTSSAWRKSCGYENVEGLYDIEQQQAKVILVTMDSFGSRSFLDD